MPKPLVITKIQFIGTGKAEISKLSGMTKYFQYRDGSVRRDAFTRAGQEARAAGQGYPQAVSDYVRPQKRDIRWVDRGMGATHRQITRNSVELSGSRTTARMWIISPDPELMEHIPEDKRMEILGRTTERAIAYWYDDNGWGQPEYSYVMHDKQRSQDGKQMLHTHVVTPGTYDLGDELGWMDHIVRKPHIRNLHEITHEVFLGELERELGRERATQIIRERDERHLDQRYPDRKGRKVQRERRARFDKLQRVNDVMSIMKREQERKRRKRAGRQQSRAAKRRARQEDIRIYTHYHRLRERQARQQRYADRQAAWERKRVQWRAEHRDDLAWARIEEENRQMRHAKDQREAERHRQRQASIDILKKHTWGWRQSQTFVYFSDAELAEMAAPHQDRTMQSLDID